MQQIQYFKSAWGDIKNSPSWFAKLCLLALVSFIPVFGPIVVLGYLYGWAREIAWGTHEPMPARIFGNEDGKLYRRGWFVLVLTFVAALVPSIVMQIGSALQGMGLWGIAADSHTVASSLASGFGLLIYLVGLVGALLLAVLAWIGSMRISIYDRLSAGFQFGKIWKMFRHDTNGAMRIFGMYLLVGLILGIVVGIVFFIVFFLIMVAGFAGLAAGGYNVAMMQHMTDAQAMRMLMQFIGSAGVVGLIGILAAVFLTYLANVFILALVVRAIGYWTMQFEVPHWRGQDDPMPFETEASFVAAMPVNPVPPTQATYDAYGQQAQQPTQPVQQPAQPIQPVHPVEQVTQPVQPAQQPTQPVEQPALPVEQPTQPVEQAAVPVEQSTQLVDQPTQPVVQLAEQPASDQPTVSETTVDATNAPAED